MNLLFVASIILATVASALGSDFKACSHNEVCIDIMDCPKYSKSTSSNKFWQNWQTLYKRDYQRARKQLCNMDVKGSTTILSVCCSTQLNSAKCGTNDRRKISYGKAARPLELPWMVVLQTQQGNYVCGGTLITDRYVLTAAHCLTRQLDKVVAVRVGQTMLTSLEDDSDEDSDNNLVPVQVIPVEYIRHPLYSARRRRNDIALLRLSEPAKLGDNVNTICLPNGTPEQAIPPEGLGSLIVSGYGLTENGSSFDMLRYASLPHVPLESCIQLDPTNLRLDPNTQLCAGGVDLVDNCIGDSGGPLQAIGIGDQLQYIQYGVVAFGEPTCGQQNSPGVYTNVVAYLSWIFKTVEGIA